jgi:hypothetical protein
MTDEDLGLVQVLADSETGNATELLAVDKKQGFARKRYRIIQDGVFKDPCTIEHGRRFGDDVLHTVMLNHAGN